MSEVSANRSSASNRLWRNIGAAFVGILTAVVPAILCDALMRAIGVFPASGQTMMGWQFLLATFYRTIFSIAGSYVAARLAVYRPMGLALVLGWIGLFVNLLGLAAAWTHPELGPRWYPIALTVLALPCAWLGGRLAMRQRESSR